MNMDWRMYIVSVLTFVALRLTFASSEQTKRDVPLDGVSNVEGTGSELGDVYSNFLQDGDVDDIEKRRSLMRFGKRRSLMRFGKRGTILRFGKRPSIMRFGKRGDESGDSLYDFIPDDVYNYGDDVDSQMGFPSSKRGSIMRFGKRPSIMRFGRSDPTLEKKPNAHVPWRFGKDLDDYLRQYQ